ncbi:MAG TPA: radical SAM family RiPP maturation amino acid epimerase [Pseudobacteroides sp.]|uniref:radical SAM family RiPP maturation amino acid epimerase n=1 Tax=Pseudobacteroides sp. TaxID=1968840 RepID=UPI002F92D0B0
MFSNAENAGIHPLLDSSKDADTAYIKQVSDIKRVLERWTMDEEFRKSFNNDSIKALRNLNVSLNPDEVLPFIDPKKAAELHEAEKNNCDQNFPISVRRYRAFIKEKITTRQNIRYDSTPSDISFSTWRNRQINRCLSELGYMKAEALVHSPITIELNTGCSVGCWFCALSAKKLEKVWQYNDENAMLWQECLNVLKKVVGNGAKYGVCYWASDPFDNPDYENFITDFYNIMGRCPQTTTALSTKNIERTRSFLKLSRRLNSHIDRFSILSLDMLNKVHSAFTPEELLRVELIPQNIESESRYKKANAGRARDMEGSNRLKEKVSDEDNASTIACVSGFKISMPEKKVQLITPCRATKQYPNGYWILDEGSFNTSCEFKALLERMIEDNMPRWVGANHKISLRPDLQIKEEESYFIVYSKYVSYKFDKNPYLGRLKELISQGDYSAADIALDLEINCKASLEDVFNTLNEFFINGFLENNTYYNFNKENAV